MSDTVKLFIGIAIAVVAILVTISIVTHVVHFLLGLVIPVLLVIGAGYVVYSIFGQKSIGGGRRLLP